MAFQTNGVMIDYQNEGEGAPVLLLHGWGGRSDSMRPFFDLLKGKRAVYAIDFPGYGNSSMPPKPWTVGDYANATLAFIKGMDIMGCDVIAHSFGGRVVVKLAARDETVFNRIVLCGVPGARKRRTPGYYIRVYRFKLVKKLSRYGWFCGLMKGFGMDAKARVANAGSSDYRQLPEQMKRTFSLIVNENLRPLLKHVKNPTLLLWGEDDREAPLWIAKLMEKEIPDCGLVTYKGAGHFAYLERWNEFAPVIAHYLLHEGAH